ncbi:methyltransferase domain-containing protein [Roseobacter sp. GAI101]|uniref:methyltransferase domain-containing protein n=1 Tax=Roseobacter sp. (strain GAI101) TaxID=391589 RepID=UPI0001872690|nr:methyltransferase domain-containing protein [Roseobacter sp. GAI101]EEB85858.1 UbiE/COQ5 methyltransferase familiy protein [Roseobacter sp. GAI101]
MLKFDEETTKLLEIAYQGGDVTRRRRKAFDALHLAEGDTVFDIGCGNGLLTEEIARAIGTTGRVIGVDPSADMRALASARCAAIPSAQIKDGVAGRLKLRDGEADKAVAVQVLEYLPDIPSAIDEAHRILRVGGRFVAVDTGCKTLDWFSDDKDRMQQVQAAWDHHYTEPRVAALWPRLTREAGFSAIEVEPFTFCDVTLRPDGIAFMLMHLMSRYTSENGHMTEADTRAWFDEQVALANEGRFFFSLTYYRMSAVKL